MKTHFIIAVLLIVLYCSCTSSEKEAAVAAPEQDTMDTFFPVTSFIKGQILLLDSLPVTPLHIRTIKDRSDSNWVTKEKLKPYFQPFLNPVISETNLSDYFKETRFEDQTLNAITFTYDPKKILPDSISLRHWDIYIDPQKGNVTKVYIVKEIKDNGQILTQLLTWQSGSFAKIATLLNKPGGEKQLLKEDLYTWDF